MDKLSVRAVSLHPLFGVTVIIVDEVTESSWDEPLADFVIITTGKVIPSSQES